MPLIPLRRAAGLLMLALLWAACDTTPGDSLFDPERPAPRPNPIIASIEPGVPPGIVLAGIDEITIHGEHFPENLADVRVYFNDVPGTVVETSPTRLRVRVPNLPSSDIEVRVMVLGAMEFGGPVAYALTPAVLQVAAIARGEQPAGLAVDREGNLYVSIFAGGNSRIRRVLEDGEMVDYFSTNIGWTGLDFDRDGLLHGVRGLRAAFRLPEGGAQQAWVVLPSTTIQLVSARFDADGMFWAGSRQGHLYRMEPDQSYREYPVSGEVQDLAVVGGYVYTAETAGTTSRIFRYALSGDGDLGPAEELLNVSSAYNAEALAIAVAADGTVFVGTRTLASPVRRHDAMLRIPTGGAPEVLYPGVLASPATTIGVSVISLAWDTTTGLYALRRFENTQPAANQPPITYDFIRIETRQAGPAR
jgi:hypothetical protein